MMPINKNVLRWRIIKCMEISRFVSVNVHSILMCISSYLFVCSHFFYLPRNHHAMYAINTYTQIHYTVRESGLEWKYGRKKNQRGNRWARLGFVWKQCVANKVIMYFHVLRLFGDGRCRFIGNNVVMIVGVIRSSSHSFHSFLHCFRTDVRCVCVCWRLCNRVQVPQIFPFITATIVE